MSHFSPMNAQWQSFYLYPLETLDVFLVRGVIPFLENHVWPFPNRAAFFIRYRDKKGPYIRLRLRGDVDFRPLVHAFFAERCNLLEKKYRPECARFGGKKNMEMVESLFTESTFFALQCWKKPFYTYADAFTDAIMAQLVAAISVGMTKPEIAAFFQKNYQNWLPRFFEIKSESEKTAIESVFFKSYRQQNDDMTALIEHLWYTCQDGMLEQDFPRYWTKWAKSWQKAAKEWPECRQFMPDLIHLTLNRMGIHNQDEVFQQYLIYQTFS